MHDMCKADSGYICGASAAGSNTLDGPPDVSPAPTEPLRILWLMMLHGNHTIDTACTNASPPANVVSFPCGVWKDKHQQTQITFAVVFEHKTGRYGNKTT